VNNYFWKFTRTQLIILSIMASMTIFVFTIDIYYLLRKNNNPTSIPPVSEITTTSGINTELTDALTTEPIFTYSVPTELLSSALPQISTQPIRTTSPVPTSNQIITSTPSPTLPSKFFNDEWDDNTNNWKWFSTSGNDNLLDVYNEAGVLVFSLLDKDTNAYFIYKPWEYDNVRISTQFEVRSNTKISTVIICNYTDEYGWYEFDIGTNGLWDVRLHDTLGKTGYLSLISGGSLAIQTGQGINEYTATCNGNHLNLSINGSEVLDFTDETMKFERGKIGLGVLSYSQVPVLVESAWVKVNQP